MARRAFEIFESAQGTKAHRLALIEDELEVSNPTARNLVNAGRRAALAAD